MNRGLIGVTLVWFGKPQTHWVTKKSTKSLSVSTFRRRSGIVSLLSPCWCSGRMDNPFR